MANINIFYSWQSDLPGAETRNFIQSCIDAAVKTLKGTWHSGRTLCEKK